MYAQYSYDVDAGLWDSEAGQHRVRRDVSNLTSDTEMPTGATDSTATQHDDEASFYDDTDYYNNVYDDDAYGDYRFYSRQSHYNKVWLVAHRTTYIKITCILANRKPPGSISTNGSDPPACMTDPASIGDQPKLSYYSMYK